MKEGWTYKKLGEVCEIRRGLTYSKNDETDYSSKVVLRSNNINLDNHQINYDELKYLKEDFVIPEDKLLTDGELLMCMSNGSKIHLGKVALYQGKTKYAFGGFMAAIHHNDALNDRFFYYSLISKRFHDYIKRLSDGANINNLKIGDIENYELVVPSINEQQAIVEKLDAQFAQLDQLKANAEKELAEAKDLFQKALEEYLSPKEGWEEKKLGEICGFQNGFAFKSSTFKKNGDPILRISDIQDEQIILSSVVYFQKSDYNINFEQFTVNNNDIVIAMSGGTTGKIGKNKTDTTLYLNQRVGKFIPSEKLNNDFLFYYLLTKKDEGLKISAGAAQPNLSTEQIKSYILPLPPLSTQQTIVEKLNAISERVHKLEDNCKTIATYCDDMKQQILKETFE